MQKFKVGFSTCVVLLVFLLIQCSAIAETPEERRARWDKGPRRINMRPYPVAVRENYKVFSKKCSKCHNLSRPINSDYVLPDEWQRYVKRMMRKPGSGINKKDGKKIYEFLIYDGSIRKADLLEEKLSNLSDEERKAQENKIAELKSQYEH